MAAQGDYMRTSNRLKPIVMVVLLPLCLALGYFLLYGQADIKEPVYPIPKVIQYSFDVKNETNHVLNDVAFSVYAPVELTATQKVLKLRSSHEYTLEKDTYNNQVMHFKYERLAPFESLVVRVRAELAMAEESNNYPEMHAQAFLDAEPLVESDHKKMVSLAKKLTKDTAKETLRSVFDFVGSRIEYAGYVKEDRGALYALTQKKGDCTEFTYLFNALSRASSIPSRAIGGYVYAGNATFKPKDYHNWSEVFVDGAWRIVDAQNKVFMAQQSHFIAMRIITPESEALLKNSHQFAYFSEGISIHMN